MAVTQISTIQVRRGLQQDIGNLAAGEFAWAIDTQRLFIGNGTIDEGAPIGGITELLTANFDISEILGTYRYRGLEGGYEVVTGPDTATPVERSFQNKIDDFVNVRDFGARGNGLTDDTDSIQRAIDEIYDRKSGNTRFTARRALRFNGGRYRITRPLKVPPYATLIGEGVNSVHIICDGVEAESVLNFVTNNGALPGDPQIPPFAYPNSIFISSMSFIALNEIDIVRLDQTTNCVFVDVNFTGPLENPDSNGNDVSCISVLGYTENVQFLRCSFKGLNYAVYAQSLSSSKNISFNKCRFEHCYSGVIADRGVSSIKITDSIFNNIYEQAIFASTDCSGIVSSNNTFTNVGDHYQGSGSPVTPVIEFLSDNCYSIADLFERPAYSTVQRIRATNKSIVTMSVDEYLRFGNSYTTPGINLVIPANSSSVITDVINFYTKGIINYSAKRNDQQRIGTIKFSTDGNNDVRYDEEYTESDDIGLVLNLRLTSGKVEIEWNANNDAGDINFSFDIKSLH